MQQKEPEALEQKTVPSWFAQHIRPFVLHNSLC